MPGEPEAKPPGLDERLDEVPDLSYSMELVQKVQDGQDTALDELLRRYTPRLKRIIGIKLGPGLRRRVEADDIAQEVFMIAVRKIEQLELRSKASILQWLTKIAENVIRAKAEYFSAQKRNPKNEVRLQDLGAASDEFAVQVPIEEPSPSQQALRSEFQGLIDSYVEELDPTDYRDVILFRDYQECEWEEVREQLERPTVAAAQELYRRAHQKLREKMRRHLERPG